MNLAAEPLNGLYVRASLAEARDPLTGNPLWRELPAGAAAGAA